MVRGGIHRVVVQAQCGRVAQMRLLGTTEGQAVPDEEVVPVQLQAEMPSSGQGRGASGAAASASWRCWDKTAAACGACGIAPPPLSCLRRHHQQLVAHDDGEDNLRRRRAIQHDSPHEIATKRRRRR